MDLLFGCDSDRAAEPITSDACVAGRVASMWELAGTSFLCADFRAADLALRSPVIVGLATLRFEYRTFGLLALPRPTDAFPRVVFLLALLWGAFCLLAIVYPLCEMVARHTM